jgi:hypothetical protein
VQIAAAVAFRLRQVGIELKGHRASTRNRDTGRGE